MLILKQRITRKIVLLFTLTVIITSLVTYGVVQAITPTITIGVGTPVSTASYIIYQQGLRYYARNGLTGAIDYSSTNASYVFNTVLKLGGEIHVNKGIYYFTSPILVSDSNFILEGEGWGDIYNINNGNGTFLYKQFNGNYLIQITYSAVGLAPFTIRDLAITSNKTIYTGGGILINNAYVAEGWLLSNLRIRSFTLPCLNVSNAGKHTLKDIYASYSDSTPIYYYNVGDWQWYNVEADNGLTTNMAGAMLYSSIGQIIGGHFEGYYGLYIQAGIIQVIAAKIVATTNTGIYLNGASYSKIIGSAIHDVNQGNSATGYGIMNYHGNYITISGNDFFSSDNKMRYCIAESGGTPYVGNVYSGNSFYGYLAGPVLTAGWPDTQIYGNSGFRTENTGSQLNGTAHTFIIAHNLYNTPTGVWVSFNTSMITGWTWTSTSTTLTITVTGSGLPVSMICYWNVKFNPE